MPSMIDIKHKLFPVPAGWTEEENDSAIQALLCAVIIAVTIGAVMVISNLFGVHHV